jgi:hypothetical protein
MHGTENLKVISKFVINWTEECGLDCYGLGNIQVLGSCEHDFEIISYKKTDQ